VIQTLIRTILHFFFTHTIGTLFVLLTIEEAGIPIPIAGDYLIALAGARPHQSPIYAVVIVGVSSIAVLLGSSLLFALARWQGRPLLEKYGKYILLEPHKVRRMEQWFSHNGPVVLIAGRLIPGLRIPTTVMAGLSTLSYRRFFLYNAIAAILWSGLYFLLGAALGREWRRIAIPLASFIDDIPRWLLIDVGIIAIIAVVWQQRDRLRRVFVKIRNRLKNTPSREGQ
jgi:membrane protein DedA with SNARE-associated domain